MSSTNDTNQNKNNTLLSLQSHIFTYHFHTNNVNELETFSIGNHLSGYIYMHAPFSTSLDTLLRSSKAEKLLNLICPIVLLFTSFALPSTDKFAENNVQLPRHLPFYLLYFSSPYFGKTFFGERKKPGVLNIVLIIPFTFFL